MKKKNAFSFVISRVRQALRQHQLLPKSDRVLIALSGGQDSIALSETLRYLHGCNPWRKLSLVHCDHKWPEDEGTVPLIQKYSEHTGMHLHVVEPRFEGEVGMSENEAREWRYAEMNKLALHNDYNVIVTAHTQTDLAETLLYNLCNGSSSNGLSSLSWKRKLFSSDTEADVHLVRPFLGVSRADTLRFCEERKLKFWVDSYNLSGKYKRNRIRLEIIPMLQQHINPNVEVALAKTGHLLRDEVQYLEMQVDSIYDNVVVHHPPNSNEDDGDREEEVVVVRVNREELAKVHIALQRRVLRRLLQEHAGLSHNSANFQQVENMRSLLNSPILSSIPSLPNKMYARVELDNDIAIRRLKTDFEKKQAVRQLGEVGDGALTASAGEQASSNGPADVVVVPKAGCPIGRSATDGGRIWTKG